MKKTKIAIFVIITFILTAVFPIAVKADFGPKPFVEVEINGMDNISYTVTLIAKYPRGPGITYEDWLKIEDPYIEYHPIMEYVDDDGYMWVGNHFELVGSTNFTWGYYPPNDFKILILTDDGKYYVSEVLNRYAFASYFEIDLSNVLAGDKNFPGMIKIVKRSYKITREVIGFTIRLIATIAVELGIAWLFMFRTRKDIKVILIVNIITQVLLNGMLNITSYFQGAFSAIFLLVFLEIIVLLGETIFYTSYFKNNRIKAAIYGVLANIVTFGLTLVLFSLELNFL